MNHAYSYGTIASRPEIASTLSAMHGPEQKPVSDASSLRSISGAFNGLVQGAQVQPGAGSLLQTGTPSQQPVSMVVVVAHSSKNRLLCEAFARALPSATASRSLLSLELDISPALRGADLWFAALELKLRANAALLPLLGSVPTLLIDCDVALLWPDGLQRLLALCPFDVCFMGEDRGWVKGNSTKRGSAGCAQTMRGCRVNGGLIVIPDPASLLVRRLVRNVSVVLSAAVRGAKAKVAWQRVGAAGDQTVTM